MVAMGQTVENTHPNDPRVWNDKYVVFKRDEFAEFEAGLALTGNLVALPDPVTDAWVTRAKDAFATAVGSAYSNAVQNVIDILSGPLYSRGSDSEGRAQAIGRLEKIRNAAFAFTRTAEAAQTKLPD